jgi:hypothetical protein
MFKVGETYKTVGGGEVTIYATDIPDTRYQIHGAITYKSGEIGVLAWTSKGCYYSDNRKSNMNLMPNKIEREVYINVYSDGTLGSVHSTAEDANRYVSTSVDRKAVKFKLTELGDDE